MGRWPASYRVHARLTRGSTRRYVLASRNVSLRGGNGETRHLFGLLSSFGGCARADERQGRRRHGQGRRRRRQGPEGLGARRRSKTRRTRPRAASGRAAAATPPGRRGSRPPTAPINQPISDKIDFAKKKANDWRKFTLAGKPGQFATFELHWDEESANLDIDVFDKFGVNIGKSPRRIEGQSSKKVLLRIDDPGLYYVRVSGPTKADSSIYTMMVKYNGPVVAKARAGAARRRRHPRRRQRRRGRARAGALPARAELPDAARSQQGVRLDRVDRCAKARR